MVRIKLLIILFVLICLSISSQTGLPDIKCSNNKPILDKLRLENAIKQGKVYNGNDHDMSESLKKFLKNVSSDEIVFMAKMTIYPDTLTNEIKYKIDSNSVIAYSLSNNDFFNIYIRDTADTEKLSIYECHPADYNFDQEIFNSILLNTDKSCFYTFNVLPFGARNYYYFLFGGKPVFYDGFFDQGNLTDFFVFHFGSIENYIQVYKERINFKKTGRGNSVINLMNPILKRDGKIWVK